MKPHKVPCMSLGRFLRSGSTVPRCLHHNGPWKYATILILPILQYIFKGFAGGVHPTDAVAIRPASGSTLLCRSAQWFSVHSNSSSCHNSRATVDTGVAEAGRRRCHSHSPHMSARPSGVKGSRCPCALHTVLILTQECRAEVSATSKWWSGHVQDRVSCNRQYVPDLGFFCWDILVGSGTSHDVQHRLVRTLWKNSTCVLYRVRHLKQRLNSLSQIAVETIRVVCMYREKETLTTTSARFSAMPCREQSDQMKSDATAITDFVRWQRFL